jgi:hypothetical protein
MLDDDEDDFSRDMADSGSDVDSDDCESPWRPRHRECHLCLNICFAFFLQLTIFFALTNIVEAALDGLDEDLKNAPLVSDGINGLKFMQRAIERKREEAEEGTSSRSMPSA